MVDGNVSIALGTDFEMGLQTGMASLEMQLMRRG
jgi:imidazolonepropionase-like amidohydrolase